jgi:hypothetical protein
VILLKGSKLTFQEVNEYVMKNSECILLSNDVPNGQTLLKFQCKCDVIFEKSFDRFKKLKKKYCKKCIHELKEDRFTYDFVKNYIEVKSKSGCILLSKNYTNTYEELELICPCGNVFSTQFTLFKKGKHFCNKCGIQKRNNSHKLSFEHVKDYIETNTKFKLLSKKYVSKKEKLSLLCDCGNIEMKSFDNLQNKKIKYCNICNKKKLHETKFFVNLDSLLIINNLEFINFIESEVVRTTKTRFKVMCKSNHIFETCFSNLRMKETKVHCRECYSVNLKGSQNPSFKGNRSLYDFCRKTLDEWKRSSMIACNYKCILTGGEFDVVHHLFSFHKILDQLIDELNIPLYETINLYSDEELKTIEKKCLELHNFYGLGVCLNKQVHMLFHSIYGKTNNTPEQFEEFKTKYLNGDFILLKGIA